MHPCRYRGRDPTLRVDFRVERAGEQTVVTHQLGDLDTSIPGRPLVRVAESGSGRRIEGMAVSLPGEQARMTDG